MTAREVELSGGAPWGFRMHGGADHNQPLRISRVNPGRKASLGGIREGDVISSINGRPTKGMSNADAHAMLRSAGPMLRLGLNEDRAMSPRRSIGKGSELKRPSQLIAEVHSGRATPQAPVYATIRPSQSPHSRLPSSARASLNSLPAALNSTPLVKSVASNEEPPKFHPTNPFYTTLPSNYSSASKLPVPNGKPSLSTLDRSKLNDTASYNDYGSDLKSPTFFTQSYDFGSSSLPYSYHSDTNKMVMNNGYDSHNRPPTTNDSNDKNPHGRSYDKNQSLPNDTTSSTKNPFDTKRNSDPFEKYLRPDGKLNGGSEYEGKTMPSSISDSNFHSNEEITKRSTVTERKISEVEEVKTIKKIVLNGCATGNRSETSLKLERPQINKSNNGSHSQQRHFTQDSSSLSRQSPRNESVLSTHVLDRNDYFNTFNQDERNLSSASGVYESVYDENRSAKAPASEVVAKPPVKSPSTHTAAAIHSPTSKREHLQPISCVSATFLVPLF